MVTYTIVKYVIIITKSISQKTFI